LAKAALPFLKKPDKEVVTLSSAIRLDKRAKPVPVAKPKSQPPRPRSPESPPNPQTLPELPAPAKVVHELAKSAPNAPPNPTPLPSQASTALPEKRVADLQKPAERAERPRQATLPSHLSQEEISRIENDLSRTIAQARSDTNPLAVPRQAPAAPRRYTMQMNGVAGDPRNYQGTCEPTGTSWQDKGFDFYYVACNVLTFKGTVERQPMPWPVHYPPNRDPFNGSMTAAQVERMNREVGVPGPAPDFKLPSGAYASPEMRDYARRHGVEI
jgi:hypothetical protein